MQGRVAQVAGESSVAKARAQVGRPSEMHKVESSEYCPSPSGLCRVMFEPEWIVPIAAQVGAIA